jgi:hypothetical protein
MFKRFILVFFLFFVSIIHAQFRLMSNELLEKIRHKNLIVVLKNETPTKEDNIEEEIEIKFNTLYNIAVKEEVEKYWKLTDGSVLFMDEKHIFNIPESEILNCIFLESDWTLKSSSIQGDFLMFSFKLNQFDILAKKSNIFEVTYVPDEFISNADVIFMSKVLNNHINASKKHEKYKDYFNFDSNMSTLENKTLLIDSLITTMPLDSIKRIYKENVEIESAENIAKQIVSQSKNHLFIRLIWSNSRGFAMYDVFDTSTCDIISCIGSGGVRFTIGSRENKYSGPSGTSNFFDPKRYPYTNSRRGQEGFSVELYKSALKIKKAHLKYISSRLAQKVNCR